MRRDLEPVNQTLLRGLALIVDWRRRTKRDLSKLALGVRPSVEVSAWNGLMR